MKIQTSIHFLLLLLFSVIFSCTPQRYGTTELDVDGEYIHQPTNTVFPPQIDSFVRKSVTSFDKDHSHVGITYKDKDSGTTVSLYIYPAGKGVEGRLRKEYSIALQAIDTILDKEVNVDQYAIKHEGEKYICNGLKAIINPDHFVDSRVTLYECGNWFFKVRLSSAWLSTTQVSNIEKSFIHRFDPSRLTEINPLDSMANIYYSKAAFRDSTLLGSAMGSAYKKVEWALKNVDEKERASGFPDLYLEMHIEALKAFINFDKEHNFSKSEFTKSYLDELNAIMDAGFLPEFIMEQYGMVMRVPDDLELNFREFEKWKQKNPLNINLKKSFYVISYDRNYEK